MTEMDYTTFGTSGDSGFVYNTSTGKFFALDKTGKVYLGN